MAEVSELPNYAELESMLVKVGIVPDTAECHGLFCGLLCARGDAEKIWLDEVLGESAPEVSENEKLRELLRTLAAVSTLQIKSADFSFELMLPTDKQPLAKRVEALTHWCQGFYLGLGIGGISDFQQLSENAREVVQDMTDIAMMEIPVESDKQDEAAYKELVDYLRVGVLQVQDALEPLANATRGTTH